MTNKELLDEWKALKIGDFFVYTHEDSKYLAKVLEKSKNSMLYLDMYIFDENQKLSKSGRSKSVCYFKLINHEISNLLIYDQEKIISAYAEYLI